jgi:hypothetical protein
MNFGSWIKTLESTIDQALDINAEDKKKKEEEEKKKVAEKKAPPKTQPTAPTQPTVDAKPTTKIQTPIEPAIQQIAAQTDTTIPSPIVSAKQLTPRAEKKPIVVESPKFEYSDDNADYIRVDLLPVVEAALGSEDANPMIELLKNKLLTYVVCLFIYMLGK